MTKIENRTLRDAVLAEIGQIADAGDYDVAAIEAELDRLGVTAEQMRLLTADVDGQLAIDAENLNGLFWGIAEENEIHRTRTVKVFGPPFDGSSIVTLTLPWVCPRCGGDRGEPRLMTWYLNSGPVQVHGWRNPCVHFDTAPALIEEAGL
ncbi:hypothetical protein [Mycobacteroides abscessus]|uniref:hypothetical protein n=1 Tax=Mycobacteroides abscessus TaxID=36809 RepID=UPI00266FB0FE|nr:hypothetical protein [Mycobacteroides abscessus]MDO3110451.1 hypothetical protein [Mycobacteroides abscessus subsp. abscessus]